MAVGQRVEGRRAPAPRTAGFTARNLIGPLGDQVGDSLLTQVNPAAAHRSSTKAWILVVHPPRERPRA
jgi:hypothetical protein